MRKPTRRQIAKATGQKLYVGHDCIWGHTGIRYTSNGACMECLALRQKEHKQ
jgi:hypothetical protein